MGSFKNLSMLRLSIIVFHQMNDPLKSACLLSEWKHLIWVLALTALEEGEDKKEK